MTATACEPLTPYKPRASRGSTPLIAVVTGESIEIPATRLQAIFTSVGRHVDDAADKYVLPESGWLPPANSHVLALCVAMLAAAVYASRNMSAQQYALPSGRESRYYTGG